jgi:hypothetical protein
MRHAGGPENKSRDTDRDNYAGQLRPNPKTMGATVGSSSATMRNRRWDLRVAMPNRGLRSLDGRSSLEFINGEGYEHR